MDEILEPKEVAKLLKVNPRTVVRWAEQGKLPGFKLGDLWRFRREAIENHIRRLEEGTISTSASASENEKSAPKECFDTPSSDSDNQNKKEKS